MTRLALLLPSLHARPWMWMERINCSARVQVTVRFLRLSNNVDQGVDVRFQFFIRKNAKRITGAFDGLVDIGIIERKFGTELSGSLRSHFKILHPSRILTPFEGCWYRYCMI